MRSRLFDNGAQRLRQLIQEAAELFAKREAETKARIARSPIKWCKTCGREHRSREVCRLVPVQVAMKCGRKRTHWVHPERRGAFLEFGEEAVG